MTSNVVGNVDRGDLRELHRACIGYGWVRQYLGCTDAKVESIVDFINKQPPEIVLELIGIHECVYGCIKHPTVSMTRLYELRWRL